MSILLVQGNTLSIPLADKSVQCIVTSPVYWGLRSYATGEHKEHELGSEPLHDCLGWATGNDCGECYICHMRQVARECWRVLRDDGVMFWNIADSYAGGKAGRTDTESRALIDGSIRVGAGEVIYRTPPPGLKPKDKCGIPERTALAFQADGWWWRSDIIWHKPNPMPESVTDRPTKSHEFIYVFTKAERYYWDAEAVREDSKTEWNSVIGFNADGQEKRGGLVGHTNGKGFHPNLNQFGRNLRDVWTLATQAYPGAHFATYPSELPRRCIKAATSERGACPKCGAPWVRVVITVGRIRHESEPQTISSGRTRGYTNGADTTKHAPEPIKIGESWEPSCNCLYDAGMNDDDIADILDEGGPMSPVPCVVLDPFSGAATTGLVARELNRHYIGLELSAEYLKQSRDRLSLTALEEWGNGRKHDADLSDLPMFKV